MHGCFIVLYDAAIFSDKITLYHVLKASITTLTVDSFVVL